MKAFISWSGGKESCLSCYEAMQSKDIEVSYLLNMISEDGRRSRSHGISVELLRVQSEAMGIPILQIRSSWEDYEKRFKRAVLELKEKGIEAGIFGDIDLEQHRAWVERVCKEMGIKAILPLWGREREDILKEFINLGFEAIVVATSFDKNWLGRKIDKKFLQELKTLEEIDLCGENGEYHTFVTDGPIFKKRIKILETKIVNQGKNLFLDILSYFIEVK
ncbi:ATPase [Candidatus Desulfofervidus auxilii]|uniref:ATPase n=1 Tax=Desulfofervidus auxilii TaxID=1621989 RepID=A0A7U4QKP1_DESA2|nr:diphthine--ammonia ligase [Candidatus Desulfofervidus auxilii]AMM41123.1 ATPase [Candidatus Desulfofervidus auxilii]